MHRLTGIGVSPGIATGRAVLLRQDPFVIRFPIGPDRVEAELARLDDARERSRRQLREIQARVASAAGGELSSLFDAQLLMLDDAMLVARARDLIRCERVNAEWAVQQAFEVVARIFDDVEDPYLRERKGDVADVAGRLRMNLSGGRAADLFRDVDDACVLVADDLTPSMAAQVDWRKIRGFASETGSHTHHTAILARSLRVPAVVGLGEECRRIPPGATVLVDGSTGELILDPSEEILERARGRASVGAAGEGEAPADRGPAITRDGVKIALRANIELREDLAWVQSSGAEGVGLYRSEFLLATTPSDALTEDVQYAAYRALLEGLAPGPLSVRTFDVGEEQLLPWPRVERRRPASSPRPGGPLGLRGIRLSLARREVFKTQLLALLRAARHGELRVIFPFVSGLEELRDARAVLREAQAELEARGEPVGVPPPVGVMIEIPSAAVTADLLAGEADFFSIGTNDLIQYTLAVDRTDPGGAGLYEPLHPAVLRLLRTVIRAASRRRLPVSLCGEMAADPALLPLLVGLGLREFSMSPSAIATAREVVLGLDTREAARLAARVLRMGTVAEIERGLAGPRARMR